MPYPSYGNIEVVSKSVLLKDILTIKDAIKKLKDIEVELPEKVIRDAKFVNNKYENGIWEYTLFNGSLSVTYIGDKTKLILTYNDMPFERIYTEDNPDDGYPVTGYYSMFEDTSSPLTSITITGWTNKNVENISGMFYGCSSLTGLNLVNFKTNKVKDMRGVFFGCSALTSLNLSKWNTSQVTTMSSMFDNCKTLKHLNLSSFNTSQVISMLHMFSYCTSLTSLNISNWNTSSVTDTTDMFRGCPIITVTAINANIENIIGLLPQGSIVIKE